VLDSAKKLLERYFIQNGLTQKFSLNSTSDITKDKTLMINSFEDVGNPLVYWVSTTLRDEGIGSFFVPSIQLRSDVEYTKGIVLRAACNQGSCLSAELMSLVDKVCLSEDTKQICNKVSAGVGNENLLGLYFKLANLGTHNQPASTFTLVLSNKQKMIKLFMVTFGDTVIEDNSKRVVKLAPGAAGTYEISELIITGMHDSSRFRAKLRQRH
jgi:hypothetical protein